MTLCLAFVSAMFAGCVSDRRLTSATGVLAEDFHKSGSVEYVDGFATYSIAGLARVGRPVNFEVDSEVAELLCRSGEGGVGTVAGLRTFADLLSTRICGLPISQKDRRLSVVFAGYVRDETGQDQGFIALVSNFENVSGEVAAEARTTFALECEFSPIDQIAMHQIGSGRLRRADMEAVAALLAKPLHPRHATARAVQAVREAAARDLSHTVGYRCTSIFVQRGNRKSCWGDNYTDVNSPEMSIGAFVNAKWDEEGAFLTVKGRAAGFDANGAALASRVAKVPRNTPCPCNSGQKYKRCHGRPGQTAFGPEGARSVDLDALFKVLKQPTVEVELIGLSSGSRRPRARGMAGPGG